MSTPALASALGLAPHPAGGWYRRTWTSPVLVDTPRGPRPTATAILYLLDAESAWHRVHGAAGLWCWHRGCAVELLLGGAAELPAASAWAVLGPDAPQAHVPAGHWQSARLLGVDPALVSCVVSPGFDFADFELAPR